MAILRDQLIDAYITQSNQFKSIQGWFNRFNWPMAGQVISSQSISQSISHRSANQLNDGQISHQVNDQQPPINQVSISQANQQRPIKSIQWPINRHCAINE